MSGFGYFTRNRVPRLGWRTGEEVVDLAAAGLLAAPSLGALFDEGRTAWEDAAVRITAGVEAGAEPRYPIAEVELRMPFEVADFVDFSASLEHTTTMGRLFRPDGDALLPNWRHVPVGYHGRAGTIVVSGTEVTRPSGQLGPGVFGPTEMLDVEVELGFVVGANAPTFRDAVFGVVLVNDWSARDIQEWEYRPLGPFLAKSFATSISAWVTPLALLDVVAAPKQDPEPLAYLRVEREAFDVETSLEVNGEVIARQNARTLYWTGSQLVAHLTSNGTPLRPGDLYGSGTISSPEPGSLIERGGPYLSDGDEVVIRGRSGPVDLGEVRGRIVPSGEERKL